MNVAEIPKGRRVNPDIKDFKKLNKVVLKEGGTNAASNHALRANHDLKIAQKTGVKTRQSGFSSAMNRFNSATDVSYGRPNRPQTPVGGVMENQFGE